MNEIEQMYRNAGVEKQKHAFLFQEPDGSKEYYPPFTPEKQLEVVKVLAQRTNVILSFNFANENWKISTLKRGAIGEEFDNVLANLVNAYWPDLTEDEKQKIWEILK